MTTRLPALKRDSLPDDPFQQFQTWLDDAVRESGLDNPNAMFLTTAGEDGVPEGRIVLLKELDDVGFVFFTNRESRKGVQLDAHPKAGLTFFWDVLGRQVRIVGEVARVSDEVSDAYFASRDRGSQVGAWASQQSQPLESREALERRVREFESKFDGDDVQRPPHWGGYRVTPQRIEFWQAGEYRLHDRFEYARAEGQEWTITRLSP